MSVVENCKNCAFGVQDPGSVYGYRYCHRRPPVVYEGITGLRFEDVWSHGYRIGSEAKEIRGPITAWPKVGDSDFCGEFELKDAS